MSVDRTSPVYLVAFLWGVGGVVLMLGRAVWKLAPLATEAIGGGLSVGQWGFFAGWMVFMLYTEGYRGFQQRFSPRVAARAMYLARNPRPLHLLLAPAFCMGYFYATRKRKIVAWALTAGIVLLVVLIRLLDQPWRGIIDAGVVGGLTWGSLATLYYGVVAMVRGEAQVEPEVPTG